MKILVITSRYTATRDIIGEDFGRQTRLFEALKKLKHDIDFLCADYRQLENSNQKLHGINIFIRPFGLCHFLSFTKSLDDLLKKRKYDLLIATSDPLWGVLGYYYAKRYKIKFLYDLHDNYETYLTYKIPFFGLIDKKIIKKASIVTTVSKSLKKKISSIREEKVFVIENGADINIFKPKDKTKSRKKLNLPLKAKIIGYSGTLQKMQGIDVLLEAFNILKKNIDNVYLVLAGRKRIKTEKLDLTGKGIIWLKDADQKKIVDLINAADVNVIPNTINEFTKYCFPYKVVEYMACNAKIVATRVGDVENIVPKNCLCVANNANALAEKIKSKLNSKEKIDYRKTARKYTWDNIARKFDRVIRNN